MTKGEKVFLRICYGFIIFGMLAIAIGTLGQLGVFG